MKVNCVQTLEGHCGRVWNCAWNPAGTVLATCGEDANVRLWGRQGGGDGDDGKWVLKSILTEGHTRTVRSVGWSPCGKFLAAASFDGTVSVWDRKKSDGQFECNATLEGHENEVKSVSWSLSGHYLATCSRDKSVWVWDVDEEEGDGEYMCAAVLQAHTQDVKKVRWHPEEDLLASCGYDDKVKVFVEEDDEWVCAGTMASHASTVWAMAFEAKGDRLASCSEDKTVKVWRRNSRGGSGKEEWKCESTIAGFHDRTVYDVDWCHRTGLIATACGDNDVRVFQEESASSSSGGDGGPSWRLLHRQHGAHSQDVNSVCWNPTTEGLLASCGDDETVKVWTVELEADDQP